MPAPRKDHKPIPFTVRAVVAVLGRLPLPINHALGFLLGTAAMVFPTRPRSVAIRNLELCFPELTKPQRLRMVWQVLRENGKGLLELPIFWRRRPEAVMKLIRAIEGEDLFLDQVKQPEAILFAAPHLGAWELLNLYLSSHTNTCVLYREAKISGVDQLLREGRQRLGGRAIPASASGLRDLMRAAHAGDLLGILPDQQPKRGEGVFAPFFGQQALTMVLFSRLAAKLQCQLLVGYAERLSWGRGFRIHFLPADDAIAGSEPLASVTALNAMVEDCVRRLPTQYQWTYKRFSIQPDDTRMRY